MSLNTHYEIIRFGRRQFPFVLGTVCSFETTRPKKVWVPLKQQRRLKYDSLTSRLLCLPQVANVDLCFVSVVCGQKP